MEGRRFRRFGRVQSQTLLPLRSSSTQQLSNTISCWYCDHKISSLNESFYSFGQRHARFLRFWFAVGTGFSLSALLGVTMILIFESLCALYQFNGSNKLNDLFSSLLFGFGPSGMGFSISFFNFSFLLISTMISVAVHEFGHAVAAASEGIRMEYIAVFIVFLFPGAFVAFNDELLEMKPRSTVLRIYCAGVWHNAVFSAACGLVLLLLPFIFFPVYVYGESPMVLHVSSTSPVSAYLSPGDVVVSLDGLKIHNIQDWMEAAAMIEKQTLLSLTQSEDVERLEAINGGKGYCAPLSMVKSSTGIPLMINQSACPDELPAFTAFPCSGSSAHLDDNNRKESKTMQCLNAGDVVKLNRCDGLQASIDSGSNCGCSEDELCIFPVPRPGIAWVEIVYQNSQECMRLGSSPFAGSEGSRSIESCDRRFVYTGDLMSMAHSVLLVAYQPRFGPAISAYIPYIIEELMMCAFHVSLTLALLNSLPGSFTGYCEERGGTELEIEMREFAPSLPNPTVMCRVFDCIVVYFLDGESILEVSLCYITFLSSKRRLLLKACLIGGSLLTSFVFLRTFLFKFW